MLADGSGGGGGTGASAHIGYSADNATWHADLAIGDRYIRFAVAASRPAEASSAWTIGLQFVGDDGSSGVGQPGAPGPPGPAGPGIAAGGTLAQYLAKAGTADYATEWLSLGPQLPVPTLSDVGRVAVVNSTGAGYELQDVSVPTSWTYRISTKIVPDGSSIAEPHILYHRAGLIYYLTFVNWEQSDLDKISHIPIDGLVGLPQSGGRILILKVEDDFDTTANRYRVGALNTVGLLEQAVGTDTDVLLTEAPPGTIVVANPGGTGLTPLTSVQIDTDAYSVTPTFTPIEPKALTVPLAGIGATSFVSGTWIEIGNFAESDIVINAGEFTTAARTNRRRVVFPTGGRFTVSLLYVFKDSGSGRLAPAARLAVARSGTILSLGPEGGGYLRGIQNDADRDTTSFSVAFDFQAGDELLVQGTAFPKDGTVTTVGGNGSYLTITEIVQAISVGGDQTIDPARLMPPAGTTLQALVKLSNTDYDTGWSTIAQGQQVTAATIIAANAGTPSSTDNVIKWNAGNGLNWATDQ